MDELFLLDMYGRSPYHPKVEYQGDVYTLHHISSVIDGVLLLDRDVYLYKEEGGLISNLLKDKLLNIKPLLHPIQKVLEIKEDDKLLIDIILNICDYDGYCGLYTTWDLEKNGKLSIYTWGMYLGELNLNTMILSTEKAGNFQLRFDMWASIQRIFYRNHIDYLGFIKNNMAIKIE